MAEASNVGTHEGGDRDDSEVKVREQDQFLPISNISRIMKRGVSDNGKISKDAKETVQVFVSEFISFVTSEANEKCRREKQKIITGDDIIWAMGSLGFDNYVEPLKLYYKKYKKANADRSSTLNEPRETSSAEKEGEDSCSSPSFEMAPGSMYGGGATYLPPQTILPGTYQFAQRMQRQMMAPPENQEL